MLERQQLLFERHFVSDGLAAAYAREAIAHLIERREVVAPSFDVALDGSRFLLCVTVSYRDAAGRDQTVPVSVPIT